MSASSNPWAGASIDHFGWYTPDLERSVQFWTEVMGFTAEPMQIRAQPWIGKLMGIPNARLRLVHLFGHGGHIEFITFDEPAMRQDAWMPTGLEGHICLRLRNVAIVRDRMLANGGQAQGALTEIGEDAIASGRGLYIRDPHGVLVELIEIAE